MISINRALDSKASADRVHWICKNHIALKDYTAAELYDEVWKHESLKDDDYYEEMCNGVLDSLTGWCHTSCSLLNLSNHVFLGLELQYDDSI